MMPDAKTTYAQSSDIKSRTYLQYRKDMKKKAIAELEILPWLKDKIRTINDKANIKKSGGDKFIWFLRKGGITRDPDFSITYPDGKIEYIEFQYAKEKLKAYDFKISKIAPKNKKSKKRVPKKDTKILYIIKPTYEFALIEPAWICNNAIQTVAPAWGNAPVFRVKENKFRKIFKKDINLQKVCQIIDKKIAILDFQHQVIEIEKDKLSNLLQSVIDKEEILKVTPKTLDTFFKVCFVHNHIDKIPTNASLWLIYLLSFLNQKLNSYKLMQLIYCMDFLYPKIDLTQNEIMRLSDALKLINKQIISFTNNDGSFQSDKNISPLDDTRYSLFVMNILEDLIQDMVYYYGNRINLKPITKIYNNITRLDKTFDFIGK